MSFLQWHKGLEIGCPIVDSEHKKLMQTINEVADEIDNGSDSSTIREAIEKMIEYGLYHFQHEEALFLPTAYPYAKEHMAEHAAMRESIKKIHEAMITKQMTSEVAATDLLVILKQWLAHHVQGMDVKIAPYINGREAQTVCK